MLIEVKAIRIGTQAFCGSIKYFYSVSGFKRPTVWLENGKSKNSDFSGLVNSSVGEETIRQRLIGFELLGRGSGQVVIVFVLARGWTNDYEEYGYRCSDYLI